MPLSQAGFKRVVPGKGQQLTLLSVEVLTDCRCAPGVGAGRYHNHMALLSCALPVWRRQAGRHGSAHLVER